MTLSEQLSITYSTPSTPAGAAPRASRPLVDQLERAATIIALNTAEGHARASRDRIRALRIAAAETRKTRTASTRRGTLRHVDAATVVPAEAIADRLGGVLYGLIRKPREPAGLSGLRTTRTGSGSYYLSLTSHTAGRILTTQEPVAC